jgi:hypothetical protein
VNSRRCNFLACLLFCFTSDVHLTDVQPNDVPNTLNIGCPATRIEKRAVVLC